MIIKVHNKKYDFFNGVAVNLKYDSVASTFSFNAYFNPENNDQKNLLNVGHYHPVKVEHEDELLITGTILSNSLKTSSKKELAGIGGYSLPGVLEDCNIPVSLYPLQADKLSLREIAQRLIAPFKLEMVIDSDVNTLMNKVYTNSTADEHQTIKQYLTELATQRNIVLSHTEDGELLFTKAKTKKQPIIKIESGGQPFTNIALVFNGQAMHSHITVQKQANADGGSAGESTIRNPFVPFTFRSKVITQNSGDDNDTAQAAKNALSVELKNLRLTVVLDRWTIDNKIIRPNNIISVISPDIFLYTKTNWFIESVTFKGDNKAKTATLGCVLPSVYDNSTPVNIFEQH